MPAPRHAMEERVKQVLANNPEWGPKRVLAFLVEEARLLADNKGLAGTQLENFIERYRSHLPGEATVNRIKQRFPLEEHEPFLSKTMEVEWPATFEAGFLPYAAASAYIELRRLLGNTPLLPLVRWFWKVTETAPDAPVLLRYSVAATLTIRECVQEDAPEPAVMEQFLISGPWRDAARLAKYKTGVAPFAAFHPEDPMIGRKSPAFELRPYVSALLLGEMKTWISPREGEALRENGPVADSSASSLLKEMVANHREAVFADYFPQDVVGPNAPAFGFMTIYDMFDNWIWEEEWADAGDGSLTKVSRRYGPSALEVEGDANAST